MGFEFLKNIGSTFLLFYTLTGKKSSGEEYGSSERRRRPVIPSVESESRVLKPHSFLFAFRFSEKATIEWLRLFEGSGVPYGPINNMQQVFSDPQVGPHQISSEYYYVCFTNAE